MSNESFQALLQPNNVIANKTKQKNIMLDITFFSLIKNKNVHDLRMVLVCFNLFIQYIN